MGHSTDRQVVYFEYGKTIRPSQQEFLYRIFVELFTAHLLKKIQDFIIYLSRDIDILADPKYRKIEKIVHDSVVTCSHP